MSDTKQCIRCLRSLPLEAFHHERREPDGRNTHCKDCERARQQAYYAAKGEDRRAYQRAYGKRVRQLRRERLEA